jgi:hypothetical protein
MKNLILIFLLFSFTYCQSEQDRCYEDYGITQDSRSKWFPCQASLIETNTSSPIRSHNIIDAGLILCAYTFLVDSECSKKSKIKRDTKDPLRLD